MYSKKIVTMEHWTITHKQVQPTIKVKIEHKLERYGNERGWNGGEKREENSLSRERGSEREGRATC